MHSLKDIQSIFSSSLGGVSLCAYGNKKDLKYVQSNLGIPNVEIYHAPESLEMAIFKAKIKSSGFILLLTDYLNMSIESYFKVLYVTIENESKSDVMWKDFFSTLFRGDVDDFLSYADLFKNNSVNGMALLNNCLKLVESGKVQDSIKSMFLSISRELAEKSKHDVSNMTLKSYLLLLYRLMRDENLNLNQLEKNWNNV